MRIWLAALVIALMLVAGAATAAPPILTGVYKTTITGQPAPLNGRWQLKFLPGKVIRAVRNGKTVVNGTTLFTGHRMKVTDRSGSYACGTGERSGLYTYRLAGSKLIFKTVSDKCVGRKLLLTTKPFVK
jgi:hypothetical protein